MSPCICYVPKRFSLEHGELVETANAIITEYAAQGYQMTLRQLYYQFVARDVIENTTQSSKRLGGIISDARLAGMIDWSAIEDRTRNLAGNSHWNNPCEIVESASRSYGIDCWVGQEFRCEVWVEKEALAGVVARPSKQWDLDYFSCRGYVSQSEMWSAAMRLQGYIRDGQAPIVIYLGDHDPSGLDMTRDITDRLALFVGTDVMVNRIALNWDQIEQYNPPPNPAKSTDSRYRAYNEKYGGESWELDALEPRVIEDLINDAVAEVVEMDALEKRREQQESERGDLEFAAENWSKIMQQRRNGDSG